MSLEEKVHTGLMAHLHRNMPCVDCANCPYELDDNGNVTTFENCSKALMDDYEELTFDMKNTIMLLEANDGQSCE